MTKGDFSRALVDWLARSERDGRYHLYWKMVQLHPHREDFLRAYDECCCEIVPSSIATASHLFMGAVHFHILSFPLEPLAVFFPASSSYDVHASGGEGEMFADLCDRAWETIWDNVSRRTVQINKIGRNALFAPIFLALQKGPQAIAFIDVGASVGFGLLWPYLSHHYGRHGTVDGPFADGHRSIHCKVEGSPPFSMDGRLRDPFYLCGIEKAPINSANQSDVMWLQALTAPGDSVGRDALDLGLSLVRKHHPVVHAGCVFDQLPTLAASIPPEIPLVVYHSMTVHHFNEIEKGADWKLLMQQIGSQRTMVELGVEWRSGTRSHVDVSISQWQRSEFTTRMLGETDPAADGTLFRFL